MIYTIAFRKIQEYAIVALAIVAVPRLAQTQQSYEVASIRQSTPLIQAVTDGSLLGMRVTPGRITIGHMELSKLIQTAYGIKKNQLIGPAWMGDGGDEPAFDIDIKLLAGTTADQAPAILRTLLAERFMLVARDTTKESETYALIVGEHGPTFSPRKPQDTTEASKTNDAEVSMNTTSKGLATINYGGGTVTLLPAGAKRVETSTIQGLINYLSPEVRLPIVDKTGLVGDFAIKAETPPLPQGGTLPSPEERANRREQTAFDLVSRLGLKLVPQKNPLRVIIVESVSKRPTAN